MSIPAWPAGSGISEKEKINAAFEIGTDESHFVRNDLKKPDYQGRDGGGHLAGLRAPGPLSNSPSMSAGALQVGLAAAGSVEISALPSLSYTKVFRWPPNTRWPQF